MSNRLANATSPYLLQHRDNPVDWQEWGERAFAEARERDVPVLLSVGYSACHWCHVMAHESFEDPVTAQEMNRLFVNVKVDREERPDVDSVYMEAVQAMTGRGGWPMTVWLTPDGEPFYAGTYFPDQDRHGMPSFRRVMAAVAGAWADRRTEVLEQSSRLTAAISQAIPPPGEDLDATRLLGRALEQIAAGFDPDQGGFGGAPKFPQQPVLELLLRIREEPWAGGAGAMLRLTLARMADGGIHDQLGGGFARYSVDDRWLVPHFEKMLYDNAQLARIYLWAGIELGEPRFIQVARSTLDYLLTDLSHPGGGLYSAEDADSEGVEGKFYVWRFDELERVLGAEDAEWAARFFGATWQGNFEGSNILYRPGDEPWDDRMVRIRGELLEARNLRVRPGRDDKVVAAWNGLGLRALAEAGAALADPGYLEAARRCARFLTANLMSGRHLSRTWREGKAGGPGFLDDYAAVALGMFSLHAATGEQEWLEHGELLTREILERFADREGGFFDTSDEAERLIKRPKTLVDNPSPSGNAMAAEALALLAGHTGEAALLEAATVAVGATAALMDRFPTMVAHHLSVLHALSGLRELAVVGADALDLASVFWEGFRPAVAVAVSTTPDDRIPLLAGRGEPGATVAYLCRGQVCDLPASTPDQLRAQLSAAGA